MCTTCVSIAPTEDRRGVADSLELELLGAMVRVLVTDPGSTVKVTSASNH